MSDHRRSRVPRPSAGRGFVVGAALAAVASLASSPALAAQDANFMFPIDTIEEMLREGELRVVAMNPSRGLPGERTYQATVQVGDQIMQVKYAPAVRGAEAFNNRPRYELAAYEIQKLFLDPPEYVVPPTVIRALPRDAVQMALELTNDNATPPAESTFDRWRMTLVALQYWMFNVELPEDDLRDGDMVEEDPTYERHLANFNILTYLIRHNDSNRGNFLRSANPANRRVYSVDNGVAFTNEESNRGTYWRDLRMDRYPASSIDRLREYTLDDLYARLRVLVQFQLRDGTFVQVEPGETMNSGRGVRDDETTIQLGLTDREIRNVHRRLERLIEWIDGGRYEVIP